MIIVVDGLNRHRFESLLEEMFRLRARVFAGRLGWEVEVEDGLEIDRFDALDPAYVIGLDDDGHIVSCVRALQTTGPHMLADVFKEILDGEPPLRSSRLWESTRFCVDTARLRMGRGRGTVSHATCELMAGALEFARDAGVEDIVTVIDPVIDRVLKRSDCAPYDYVGTAKPMGKVAAMAALLDCTEERIARVRAFAGIEGRIRLEDDEALALFARNPASRTAPAVRERVAAAARRSAPVAAPTTPPRHVGVATSPPRRPMPTLVQTPLRPRAVEAPLPPRSHVRASDIYAYCAEQIEAATTPEEREAATALAQQVLRTTGARAGGRPRVH